MLERVFAVFALAVCLLLLVRLGVGARRRHRIDAALSRAALRLRRLAWGLRHWRESRRAARQAARAARVADAAIRRARERGDWDGNVYRPKSFRKPPRDKMH
ncbi:MAG: hypothetical protein KGL99_02825 [Burkholderiales bacterium]|nr:hypothetical protein [Burkholderiales bacterium]